MKDLAVSSELTKEQMDLISTTIAPGATKDEMKLFLYRAKSMGLDPFRPGQIHFIKYGSSPGSIVIGLDGFRLRASKTGKHTGTSRGVMRDGSGRCIGAWCEVYRSDWTKPAREEASLAEYSTGKSQWQKMPETMIKKVAEVAALRMAFPDELGGMYSDDEMGKAQPQPMPRSPLSLPIEPVPLAGAEKAMAMEETMLGIEEEQPPLPDEPPPELLLLDHDSTDWGAVVIKVGKKYKGRTFDDVGPESIKSYCDWVYVDSQKSGKPILGLMLEFLSEAHNYLQQKGFA